MSKNGIRYWEEFKQQIVDLYNSGSSVSHSSREYGVTNVTIYKWIKEFSLIKIYRKTYMQSLESSWNYLFYKALVCAPSKCQQETERLKAEIKKIELKAKTVMVLPKFIIF